MLRFAELLGLVSSVCSDPEQGRAVTGQMGNVPWGRTQLGASLPSHGVGIR